MPRKGQDRMGWDDMERRGVTRQDGTGQGGQWRSRAIRGITWWARQEKWCKKYDDRYKKKRRRGEFRKIQAKGNSKSDLWTKGN